ncbi:MAG: hypothetical protein AAF458_12090 [Pseudomonadota bacterium]
MARYSAPCVTCREFLPLPDTLSGEPFQCTCCGEYLVVTSARGERRIYRAEAPSIGADAHSGKDKDPPESFWFYAFLAALLYIAWPWLTEQWTDARAWAVEQELLEAGSPVVSSARESSERKAALDAVYKQLGVKP